MNRITRLVIVLLSVALLGSGCSMIPGLGGGSQSGVQACSAISDTIQQAATKFSTALSQAASDPEAASKALQDFTDSLTAARSKITNADVGTALDKLTAAVRKLQDLLAKGDASSVDNDAVTAASDAVQTALTDLVSACTKI